MFGCRDPLFPRFLLVFCLLRPARNCTGLHHMICVWTQHSSLSGKLYVKNLRHKNPTRNTTFAELWKPVFNSLITYAIWSFHIADPQLSAMETGLVAGELGSLASDHMQCSKEKLGAMDILHGGPCTPSTSATNLCLWYFIGNVLARQKFTMSSTLPLHSHCCLFGLYGSKCLMSYYQNGNRLLSNKLWITGVVCKCHKRTN